MDRVYVILDIVEGKHNEAVQSLQTNPGVRWVDVLEGQWDVITAIEASNRSRLAKLPCPGYFFCRKYYRSYAIAADL